MAHIRIKNYCSELNLIRNGNVKPYHAYARNYMHPSYHMKTPSCSGSLRIELVSDYYYDRGYVYCAMGDVVFDNEIDFSKYNRVTIKASNVTRDTYRSEDASDSRFEFYVYTGTRQQDCTSIVKFINRDGTFTYPINVKGKQHLAIMVYARSVGRYDPQTFIKGTLDELYFWRA